MSDMSFLRSGDRVAFILVDGTKGGFINGRLHVVEVGPEWLKIVDQDDDFTYLRKDAITCMIVVKDERVRKHEKETDLQGS